MNKQILKPMASEPPVYLSVKQAAEFLGLSKWTLYDWSGKGKGPKPRKFGSRTMFDKRDLIAWADQQ